MDQSYDCNLEKIHCHYNMFHDKFKDYDMFPRNIIVYMLLLVMVIFWSICLIDLEMCLTAVSCSALAIKYVPDEYKTFELLIAIPNLKSYTQHINWDILT